MIKVNVHNLLSGMVIAEDVHIPGAAIPVIKRGVILNKKYIDLLRAYYRIGEVKVLPDTRLKESGKASDETIVFDSLTSNVTFDGGIQVTRHVPANIRVTAGEKVNIGGDVYQGASITSRRGAVEIQGAVTGTQEEPVTLVSRKHLILQCASFVRIKAYEDVIIYGDVADSIINARGSVRVKGKAVRSLLVSNTRIFLGSSCGNEQGELVELHVKPTRYGNLFQEILSLGTSINEMIEEKKTLENLLELAGRLAPSEELLPMDKQADIAISKKRLSELAVKLSSSNAKKAQIKHALMEVLQERSITVVGEIHQGTKVGIENVSAVIAAKRESVSFYVKENKIAFEPYKEASGIEEGINTWTQLGEIIDFESLKQDVFFSGRVQVASDVERSVNLTAGDNVIIGGCLAEGITVTSKRGSIVIKGAVYGHDDAITTVTANDNFTAAGLSFADIRAGGDINIHGDVLDSNLFAKGEIKIAGAVIRSHLYSQTKLVLGSCGNHKGESSSLMVKPYEFAEYMQRLLKLDAETLKVTKELGNVRNIIDLIKSMGSSIDTLPQETKLKLAMEVKHFHELKEKIAELKSTKHQVQSELDHRRLMKRIMIEGDIYPNTHITIENSTTVISTKGWKTLFIVENNKIETKPYM